MTLFGPQLLAAGASGWLVHPRSSLKRLQAYGVLCTVLSAYVPCEFAGGRLACRLQIADCRLLLMVDG